MHSLISFSHNYSFESYHILYCNQSFNYQIVKCVEKILVMFSIEVCRIIWHILNLNSDVQIQKRQIHKSKTIQLFNSAIKSSNFNRSQFENLGMGFWMMKLQILIESECSRKKNSFYIEFWILLFGVNRKIWFRFRRHLNSWKFICLFTLICHLKKPQH